MEHMHNMAVESESCVCDILSILLIRHKYLNEKHVIVDHACVSAAYDGDVLHIGNMLIWRKREVE